MVNIGEVLILYDSEGDARMKVKVIDTLPGGEDLGDLVRLGVIEDYANVFSVGQMLLQSLEQYENAMW